MGIFIRQLRAGEDFAKGDLIAAQMANFVYIVGDSDTRECLVVDPAWDIEAILEQVESDGLLLKGALVTHYHPDHIGGDLMGWRVEGLARLVELRSVKVHVNEHEAGGVRAVTGLSRSDMVLHSGGDTVEVGGQSLKLLHTPGHTPGSQCFLFGPNLISGDTLFIRGCGRVDLPGGDPDQMYYSLTQVLAKLPDDTTLHPGHHYSAERVSTIGVEVRQNPYLGIDSLDSWRLLMNRR